MKPPPTPRHEWRRNTRLDTTFPTQRYYDLFVDGEYQHVWVRHDMTADKYYLGNYYSDAIGEFDSIQDAEDHLVVLQVIRRFERAYG